jgi:hypothetical protein
MIELPSPVFHRANPMPGRLPVQANLAHRRALEAGEHGFAPLAAVFFRWLFAATLC